MVSQDGQNSRNAERSEQGDVVERSRTLYGRDDDSGVEMSGCGTEDLNVVAAC